MKFAEKKAVFHKKFHFWTRAINQIQNFYKKKIFFEFDQNYFGRVRVSNNSMSSPGHSRKSCRYAFFGRKLFLKISITVYIFLHKN
jgi:hypothetical protein